MKTVVILKAESESTDYYAEQLRESKFNPIFVPTLDFNFKNLESLKEKLMAPGKYLGLIFTSPRSVDAVREALGRTPLPEEWQSLHNYCVGEVTHNLAAASLGGLMTRGKESGTANSLADYIKEHFEGEIKKPFLFPCGNLKQDTLQIKLAEVGFLLEPCEVYETIPHPALGEHLVNALKSENAEFLAFFSPSGVNACYDYFTKNNIGFTGKKLIAIGPSTRRAIESKGLSVFRTAEKPTVEYLLKALLSPEDPRPKAAE